MTSRTPPTTDNLTDRPSGERFLGGGQRPYLALARKTGDRAMTMSLDEVKRQFVEQVKLRAYDDKYIDKGEEREILQLALQQGVTVDSARSALAQVCETNGYVLESAALKAVKEMIDIQAGNDGKI